MENGEIELQSPGNSNATKAIFVNRDTDTPQTNFLAQHKSQMIKSSSFDSASPAFTNGNGTKMDEMKIGSHTTEPEKRDNNPFNFENGLMKAKPSPGTSKLATENFTAKPKLDRQISDINAIRKIQA